MRSLSTICQGHKEYLTVYYQYAQANETFLKSKETEPPLSLSRPFTIYHGHNIFCQENIQHRLDKTHSISLTILLAYDDAEKVRPTMWLRRAGLRTRLHWAQ